MQRVHQTRDAKCSISQCLVSIVPLVSLSTRLEKPSNLVSAPACKAPPAGDDLGHSERPSSVDIANSTLVRFDMFDQTRSERDMMWQAQSPTGSLHRISVHAPEQSRCKSMAHQHARLPHEHLRMHAWVEDPAVACAQALSKTLCWLIVGVLPRTSTCSACTQALTPWPLVSSVPLRTSCTPVALLSTPHL